MQVVFLNRSIFAIFFSKIKGASKLRPCFIYFSDAVMVLFYPTNCIKVVHSRFLQANSLMKRDNAISTCDG